MLVRPVLCHLSHFPSPFCFSYSSDKCHIFAELANDHNPPTSIPQILDYRYVLE
jgi:hypothetical protein